MEDLKAGNLESFHRLIAKANHQVQETENMIARQREREHELHKMNQILESNSKKNLSEIKELVMQHSRKKTRKSELKNS